MKTPKHLLIAGLALGLASFASAQTIVGWDTASAPVVGDRSPAASLFNATTLASGVQSATMQTSASIDYEGVNNNAATGYGWDKGGEADLATAVSNDDYISIVIDLGSLQTSFSGVNFNYVGENDFGDIALLSDATQTTPGTWDAGDSLGTASASSSGGQSIALSGNSDLQNINGGTIEFRFYSWLGGPARDKSFGLSTNDSSLDLDFTGTAVIPEPSSYALLAGVLGLGLVMLRRRRA